MIAQILAVSALFGAAFGGVISPFAAPLVAAPGLAAPLLASPVGYAHGVPQNVAPYASSINIVNRGVSLPYAALPYPALSPYTSTLPALSPYSSAIPALSPYVSAVPAPVATVF